MFAVPLSGSIRSNFLKSTVLPLASRFCARFFAASIKALCDDGMSQCAIAGVKNRLLGDVGLWGAKRTFMRKQGTRTHG